jgi:2-polyprenyl-6-methoxyphenol hydroxylase-like FAD-dependent oxidoreductase
MHAQTVLISGLGVAGPTLAYWLRRAGFQPTLVERAPTVRDGGYVIDFWGLGYDIAEKMGLIDELNRIGYHIREMRIVGDDGRRVTGFGTAAFQEVTGGRFVTLARSDLARVLFDKIKDESDVIFSDEITALRDGADGVDVTFAKAGSRRFDLVIGADGLHSNVRKLVFGPPAQFETDLGYRVAAFEAQGYRPRDEDVYVIHNEPGRMLGRVTLRDDRSLFLFVFAAGNDGDPSDLAAQKRRLHERYGSGQWECAKILAELDRADALYFDRVSQIKTPYWSSGRVVLVGDAAFCVSLTAGQGSALAMTAAYVLAGELARAEGRHEAAFARYESLLRDYIGTKQKGAERFAAAFAPQTRFGLAFRNFVIRLCALPGVTRFALGRDIGDRLVLPDYPWAVPVPRDLA